MENKKVGSLILGIGIAVSAIILIFNYSLRKLSNITCNHGNQCTMNSTLNSQLFLSFAIVGIIFIVGLYILFSKTRRENSYQKNNWKTQKEKIRSYRIK